MVVFMVIYYGRIRKTISKLPISSSLAMKIISVQIITQFQKLNCSRLFGGNSVATKPPFGVTIPSAGCGRYVASLAFTAINATYKEWQVKTPGCRDTYPYESYKIQTSVETKFLRFVGHVSVRWPKLWVSWTAISNNSTNLISLREGFLRMNYCWQWSHLTQL